MPLCIAPPKIEIWERDTGKGFLYVAEGMLEKRE